MKSSKILENLMKAHIISVSIVTTILINVEHVKEAHDVFNFLYEVGITVIFAPILLIIVVPVSFIFAAVPIVTGFFISKYLYSKTAPLVIWLIVSTATGSGWAMILGDMYYLELFMPSSFITGYLMWHYQPIKSSHDNH